MNRIFYFLLFVSSLISAQDFSDKILLEIGEEQVMADEFIYIYQKNLKVLEDDTNDESIEAYLDRFINFQLKLKEAKSQGLDQEEEFNKEFNRYFKQFADNYIANGEVTDEMIKETYERLLKEVRVSHILIDVAPNASKEEWNEAREKAKNIQQLLIAEEANFEELAKRFSKDPSVKNNQGDMGWFKAFKMVHSFEDAAYKLSTNEVSNPVKTQFGYHIIKKTGERKSIGKLSVAHIMLRNNNKEEAAENEKQIFKIYENLKNGDDFEDLAKHFSEDKNTAENGGRLPAFEVGEINSKIFEEKAFELKNDGDYTSPFQSEFGWHIIKKIDHTPVETYSELKESLRRKIKTSNRAKLLNERIKENIMQHYDVVINRDAITYFSELVDDRIYKSKWTLDKNPEGLSKPILSIEDTAYSYRDFGVYIEKQQAGFTGKRPFKEIIEELFNRYIYTKLVEYHKSNLTKIDRKFELKINEYKNGLLIFELMERELWNKAKKDTTGLELFYTANSKKYVAPQKISGKAFTFEKKKHAKKFLRLVNRRGKPEDIALNQLQGSLQKKIESKPVSEFKLPEHFKIATKYNDYYFQNNKYIVLFVDEIEPERPLNLDEIRGQVISDYQDKLEKEWMEELKSKYSVKINEETFELLKKEFE
ncbi:MAG: peptidylprolyl isomerase [Psychroflexus maritimus]